MCVADGSPERLPTLLYGTINGVLGVIASLPQSQYTFFSKVQAGRDQKSRFD